MALVALSLASVRGGGDSVAPAIVAREFVDSFYKAKSPHSVRHASSTIEYGLQNGLDADPLGDFDTVKKFLLNCKESGNFDEVPGIVMLPYKCTNVPPSHSVHAKIRILDGEIYRFEIINLPPIVVVPSIRSN